MVSLILSMRYANIIQNIAGRVLKKAYNTLVIWLIYLKINICDDMGRQIPYLAKM